MAAHDEAIDKVRKISKASRKLPQSFDHLIAQAGQAQAPAGTELIRPAEKAQEVEGRTVEVQASPIDRLSELHGKVQPLPPPSIEDIQSRIDHSTQRIEEINGGLETPDLSFKKSIQSQLDTHATNINDQLSRALKQAGVESVEQVDVSRANPVTRFVDMLTSGQGKLETLGTYLESMATTGAPLSPPRMLSIQMKVFIIQQELEFFANVLNKSLESTKTIMNVQV